MTDSVYLYPGRLAFALLPLYDALPLLPVAMHRGDWARSVHLLKAMLHARRRQIFGYILFWYTDIVHKQHIKHIFFMYIKHVENLLSYILGVHA